MTVHILVAVRDLATETFARPFCVSHARQAVRSFGDECNNPDSEISKHADDYELWTVGYFDDANGSISADLQRIARASDLKKA